MIAQFYKLILVTHRQDMSVADYLAFVEKCLVGGVTSVQLREKNATPAFLLDYAYRLKTLLDTYRIPLIINDNLDLALEIDAHGVHLGQTDGSPCWARERLGAHQCIGLSLETEEDLQRANEVQVTYVAASAVFPTSNKHNIRTTWGLKGVEYLAKRSKHPLIAIGGINQENVQDVVAAGAQGIAIIGALHDAPDPTRTAFNLRQLIERSEDGTST
ncbi:thiamine phosphate synthase [Legionella fairfieldensis]|uniref:thiamine phosphate synthase n=1 Tax=Legionella fairfieldensis TaxID=45064 RepID=UPI000490A71C|nr:thiamine phosphate synthase [Legionella fairfieldensis]